LSQPVTAWLLERSGMSLRDAFAVTLSEYLAFSFVTASLSIGGLVSLVARFSPSRFIVGFALVVAGLCATFLIVSAIAIARRFYLIGTIIEWLAKRRVLRGRLEPDIPWINGLEDRLLVLLHDSPARFARILGVELLAQAMFVCELFVLLRALHVVVPIVFPFVIDTVLKGIDIAFLFVPMQMGVAEGGYVLVFGTLGLSTAAGLSVALVRRARGLLIAATGLATLAVLTRHSAGATGTSGTRITDPDQRS
jgi:phosphatidylglycerol lysyltransferase